METSNNKNFSLSQTEKKDFFEPPKTYFVDFPEKLIKKINRKETKIIRIDWRYVAGIAAGLALLISLVLQEGKTSRTQTSYVQLIEEIPPSDIAAYLLYSDLETNEIAIEFAASNQSIFPQKELFLDLKIQESEIDALIDIYSLNKNNLH